MRCRYIFRYYDRDEDGFLSQRELAALVQDVEESRCPNDESRLQPALEEAYKVFGLRDSSKLSLGAFLNGVGKLLFRGTSVLFRANSSISLDMDSM